MGIAFEKFIITIGDHNHKKHLNNEKTAFLIIFRGDIIR
jgi:hypothetical protein